jgi:putative nucleotidyltransferase with HDIG domain
MKLNLNSFLYSISIALDAAEKEILSTTSNHSKRVSYISLCLAKELNFDDKSKFDLCAYAMMHDNGIVQSFRESSSKENFKEAENINSHCIIGQENINEFPFFIKNKNIILYHHETYNGLGYFGKKADDIPLMSQLIFLADCIDTQFDLNHITLEKKEEVLSFIKENAGELFSPSLVETFFKVSEKDIFWYTLESTKIDDLLDNLLPIFIIDISYKRMLKISKVFSNIIDSKSEFTSRHTCELMDKAKELAEYYNLDKETTYKLQIAANLHDLGKLATPNSILEKPAALTKDEIFIIRKHASITHSILSSIEGMEDVSRIASAHHERLDGTGYPFGLDSSELSLEEKMLASLDIYQALVEDRPYRSPMTHNEAMIILDKLVENRGLEEDIVRSIDKVFSF